jgi:predicted dehydrogenase
MPVFQYRFGRGLQKLRYLVDMGLAGKAFMATSETAWNRRGTYYSVPWRRHWATALGGCVLCHAIHAQDALFHILGGVRNVYARAATLVNPIEVEDCANISMEMQSGSLASLSVTLGSVEEICRHRFCFENLVAESNTMPYEEVTSDPWNFIGETPALQKEIDDALRLFIPQREGFAGQFSRFHDALSNGAEIPVTLADARASLEWVTASYYSAERGLSVDLPIHRGHPRYESWLPAHVRVQGTLQDQCNIAAVPA